MTYSGNQRWRRTLAIMLTAVLLLGGFTMPAQAEAWQPLAILLSWTDSAGNPVSVNAWTVEGSSDQAYWARVTPEALSTGVTLNITDQTGQYAGFDVNGQLVTGIVDAGTAITDTTVPVMMNALDANGNVLATFQLYVSTQADTPVLPEPEPAQANVTIVAIDQATGAEIGRDSRTMTQGGDTSVQAPAIDGYTLSDPNQAVQVVTINDDGSYSPSPVTFYYTKNAAQANVTIVAIDQATGAEIGRDSRTMTQGGDTSVQAPAIDGYTLSDPNQAVQVVTINDDGSYSPSPVTFYYTKNAAQANVAIVAIDQATGAEIGRDSRSMTQGGDTSVQAPAIDGYTLSDPNQAVQYVTINDDGSYSPSPVTFYYTKNAAQANVAIVAIDQATGAEIGRDSRTMTQGGDTSVQAPAIDGYTLSDPNQAVQYVTINDDGSYSPSPVTFYYQPVKTEPVTATVTVRYQSEDSVINEEATLTLNPGDNQPVEARIYDGYQPDAQTQYVSVAADGTATPAEVVFRYTKIVTAPASADVRVIYRAADGAFAEEETVTLSEGTDQPIAARSYEGYTPDVQTQYVTVSADGTATPAEVVFTYAADQVVAPGPVMADVQVVYQTRDGASLGGETIRCVEGEENPVPAPEFDGYVLADPSASIQYVQVSADGVASPNPVTFIYEPVATEPEPPVNPTEVTVNVYYRNAAGADIAPAQKETLPTGVTTVVAPQAVMVPVDYDFASAAPVPVEVTAEGVATPAEVVFTFAEKPQEVEDIPVPQGEIINRYGEITGKQTNVRSTPEKANNSIGRLEKGEKVYMIREEINDKGEVWCRVWYKDQQAFIMAEFLQMMTKAASDAYIAQMGDQAPPVFTENDIAGETPAVKTADVKVIYAAGDVVLDEQTITVTSEQPTVITPASSKTDGYRLISQAAEVTVTVDGETGAPSQSEVRFDYEPLPPAIKTADVHVIYAAGDVILDEQTLSVTSEQPTVITPASSKTDGYRLISQAAEVTVTVDAETGAPSQSEVRFEYEPLPPAVKEASVKVIYVAGDLILDEQTVTVTSEQPTVITPMSGKMDGYQLISQEREITVTVDAETGAPSQSEVRFEYEPLPPAVKEANVKVIYAAGDLILDEQTVTVYSDKPTVITPASAKVVGYALVSQETQVTVTVDAETGAPSQSEVRFEYKALPPDVREADVPVVYVVGEDGRELDRQTVHVTSAQDVTVQPASAKLDGYRLVSESSVTVHVDAETGAVTPAEVRFTYEAIPTDTPVPEKYVGYALTVQNAALRTEISTAESSIIAMLPQNTLVFISSQTFADGQTWSSVNTLDEQPGMMLDSNLRHVTNEEAKYYLDQWNAAHPDQPTDTAEPPVLQGYARTVGDDVQFRSMPSVMSEILGILKQNEPVYVQGQQYVDGVAWHIVRYGDRWGYIRADLLRMMSQQEAADYINSQRPTEAPNQTPQPYNPNSLSSYGYVVSTTVNFRSGASTSASRLGTLRQYAMALVLDTQKVGNTTWYHVRYNGKDGYVSGDHFKQMTITEMNTFLTSDEYRQGVANNAGGGNNNNQNNTGSSGGTFKPAEDQTVDKWTNPNNGLHVSYEPFDPFATPEPLPTDSASPSPSTSPSGSPSPSVTIEMLPTLNPGNPDEGQESGGSVMGWVIAVLLLAAAGGGVYVYVLYMQNKRKAAQRAAQRRAQAAAQQRAGAQQARPGQPGAANQPRTGTYTSQGGTASPRPNAYQQPQARKPYTPGQSGSASTGSYQRPAGQPPVSGAEGSYQRPAGQTAQRPMGTARPEGAAPQGTQRPVAPRTEPMTGADAYRPSGQPEAPAAGYGPEGSVSQRPGRRSYRSQNGGNAYGASYRPEAPASADAPKADAAPRKNDDFADNSGSGDFS